jgi:hypothetical protein
VSTTSVIVTVNSKVLTVAFDLVGEVGGHAGSMHGTLLVEMRYWHFRSSCCSARLTPPPPMMQPMR